MAHTYDQTKLSEILVSRWTWLGTVSQPGSTSPLTVSGLSSKSGVSEYLFSGFGILSSYKCSPPHYSVDPSASFSSPRALSSAVSAPQNNLGEMLPSLPLPIGLLAIPALASLARAADPISITFSSQNAAQCDEFNVSWTGGTPSYTVTITSDIKPELTIPDEVFANLTTTSIVWTADRCPGEVIEIIVNDSGRLASSVAFALNASTNTSCLSNTERTSPQCELANATLSTPGAASSPSSAFALQEHGSALILPTLAALVAAGVALCAA